MITLSQNAQSELEEFFKDRPQSSIRIYLAPGGCSGPHLSLALDDATENDSSFEAGGFSFCIGKDLLEQVGGVNIDAGYMGFTVDPVIPFPNAGGGCGSCQGCCGGCGSK